MKVRVLGPWDQSSVLYGSQNVSDGDILDVAIRSGGPLLSVSPSGQFVLAEPGTLAARVKNSDGWGASVKFVITEKV